MLFNAGKVCDMTYFCFAMALGIHSVLRGKMPQGFLTIFAVTCRQHLQ